jgi:hypothetical protein
MAETFYLHLEFKGKYGGGQLTAFLCNKCGVCCTLEDFWPGEVSAKTKISRGAKKNPLEALVKWEESESIRQIDSEIFALFGRQIMLYLRGSPEGFLPQNRVWNVRQECEPLNRFKKREMPYEKVDPPKKPITLQEQVKNP